MVVLPALSGEETPKHRREHYGERQLAIDARRIARLAELFDQLNDGLSPEQYVSACASSDPVCDIIRGRLNRRHLSAAPDFDRGTSRYFSGKRWKGPSG